MCGLFGWVGKNPSNFDINKLHLLGGLIQVGTVREKVYRDFISEVQPEPPSKHGVVIGHTRHATFGDHTIRNAHPFGFGGKEGHAMIGAHNGSLLEDHLKIATSRNITTQYYEYNKFTRKNVTQDKIDSEILLEALYKDKDFKVLSEYNGAAALTWYYTDKPNTIYIFHGASAKDPHDRYLWIERPMFIYKESKNSMYYSSLEDSLKMIGGTDKTIVDLPYNTVFEITDGDFENAKKYPIDRNNRVHEDLQNSYYNYNYNSTKPKVGERPTNNVKPSTSTCSVTTSSSTSNVSYKAAGLEYNTKELKGAKKRFKKEGVSIYNMHVDQNSYKGRVYENALRYWRNGKLVTGIYTYVKEYGFILLGASEKHIDTVKKGMVNMALDLETGRMDQPVKGKDDFIPFKKAEDIPLYYIYKGVRVRHKMDYNVLIEQGTLIRDLSLYDNVSKCSSSPIADLTQLKIKSKQEIMFNNKPANGVYVPLGSKWKYHIEDGNLVGLTDVSKPDSFIKGTTMTVVKDEDV